MRSRWPLILLLLWAAALRFVGLMNGSPPGLSHDEVANWLIDRAILGGEHAVYFTAAYGHEAGFHYWQALLIGLIGDHALALRLAAAFLGVVVVAVTYTVGKSLFNRPVALMATAVTATHFWPVFFSRQGLRAMMLPLTAGLAIYFLWRYLLPSDHNRRPASKQDGRLGHRSKDWGLGADVSGFLSLFFFALSSYTYMASRALPILLGIWLLYLALFHRQTFQLAKKWPALVALVGLYGALSLPLVASIRAAPEAEARIAEVDGPLRAFLNGEINPILENGSAIAGMFGFAGDPLWRHNVAGRPVFGWPLALLFYAGIGVSLWRWRDPRYALLLIWAAAAAIPSLLTIDAPSSIRMILLLPILGLFPAIVIHSLSTLSTVFPQLSTVFPQNLGITVLTIIIVVFSSGRTIRDLGVVWPANEEVAFVWQRDLTAAAEWLDQQKMISDATIVGWTPATMDEPTMTVSLRREDVELRFTGRVGAVSTLVVPGDRPDVSAVLRPSILPLEPPLEDALSRLGASSTEYNGLTIYRWDKEFVARPAVVQHALFGEELVFWGFDEVGECRSAEGSICQIITYWRVEAAPADERRFFVHVVDQNGEIVAQSDALDAPARYWRVGDWLIQVHQLPQTADDVSFRLGVYDPRPPFVQLPTADGDRFLTLELPKK